MKRRILSAAVALVMTLSVVFIFAWAHWGGSNGGRGTPPDEQRRKLQDDQTNQRLSNIRRRLTEIDRGIDDLERRLTRD